MIFWFFQSKNVTEEVDNCPVRSKTLRSTRDGVQFAGARKNEMLITKTDDMAVACADCPYCGKENVVGRSNSERSGYNETSELTITCKSCDGIFTLPKFRLEIRRKSREIVDAEYAVSTLPWIE